MEEVFVGARGGGIVKLWKVLHILIPFMVGILLAMIVSFSVFYYYTRDLQPPEKLLPSSARLLYSNGSPLYLSRSVWVGLNEVPKDFVRMLLASEDRGFYRHAGLRIKGILRALFVNLTSGNPMAQGGSTITQQLVRTLYLTYKKSFSRKIKEIAIALWLERVRSKDEILEMYINSVYLGNGLYGFGVASLYYFGKPLNALDKAEMAVLIGIVKSPENYNPFADSEMAKEKGKTVLKAALDAGVIGAEEFSRLSNEIDSMEFRKTKMAFDENLFWRIVREAMEVTGLSLEELRSGYEIVTTLDEDLQKAVNRHLTEDMACVAVDRAGRILAFKGKEADEGRRQVGSAIKPMYYLLAFLNGVSPNDLLPDVPIKIGDWSPKNFTKKFGGYSTVKNALVWSRNVPSVYLFSHLGYGNVVSFIRDVFKIKGMYPPDMTISLGTIETAPEEVLKFYTALSTGGVVMKPTIIKEIRRISGGAIYTFMPQVIGKVPDGEISAYEAIARLKAILMDVVRRGTGMRAKMVGKEMFGKTGTSDINAWFIGGDDEVIMAVVKDGKDLMGGEDAAPVWKEIMVDWGKFKGVVGRVERVESEGKAILDEKMVDEIDYEQLVEELKSASVTVEDLAYFLSKADEIYSSTVLQRLSELDPGIAEEVKKELGRLIEWRK